MIVARSRSQKDIPRLIVDLTNVSKFEHFKQKFKSMGHFD
jgi:hypothetical protein